MASALVNVKPLLICQNQRCTENTTRAGYN